MVQEPTTVDESVMAGHGFYSANSRPQHAAASVAYPYLAAAVAALPAPSPGTGPVVIGDFGCAGGANEMEPMALAVDGLRNNAFAGDVAVVHTDLPENDFSGLLSLLATPASYTTGRDRLYPSIIGRTLYGPLFPDGGLHLGWSGITLHWLSALPGVMAGEIYPNLTTGADHAALAGRAAQDWESFLRERSRELVDGGRLVLVAGASQPDGVSGAEALFTTLKAVLEAMVSAGELRADELERIFYPTYNRTPQEWLAPFDGPLGTDYEVVASCLEASHDAETFPQFSRDGDAEAFATVYTRFVRAVTEHPFFRSLAADRSETERAAVVERFYERVRAALAAQPDVAAVWHVFSLHLVRRPRVGAARQVVV